MSLHISPVILASADLTIKECVLRMKKKGMGSILVISADWRHQVLGIFTERDLLKNVELIQAGGHWEKSIATVMTKKVKTVTIHELDKIPKMMLESRIRHVPIVNVVDGVSQPIGMVSQRDVLGWIYQRLPDDETLLPELMRDLWKGKVGMVSKDQYFVHFLKETFKKASYLEIIDHTEQVEKDFDGAVRDFKHNALVLVDLDHWPKEEWVECLKLMNSEKEFPRTIVVFDPYKHAESEVKALEVLSGADRFSVYQKPINLIHFMQELGAVLAQEN